MNVVLLFALTALLHAARVDLKDVRAPPGSGDEDETGGDMKLQRLRAFNETGLRMLRGRAPTFRWRWRVSPRLTLPQNCRWSGDPS
mmetsp:Transcript_37486/g.88065  ORF Transcript_37486/g.88065 Transcript_37486/m.88065 type:complete len:86 (-) Transcript_37486:1152-1409(-)